MKKVLFILSALFLLGYSSCKHKPEKIEPIVKDSVFVEYNPDTLLLEQGITTKTLAPVLLGTTPINFTLKVVPAVSSSQFSIDSLGVICIDSTAVDGTYKASVTASNVDGSFSFVDALTVIISSTPVAPSSLVYSPNSMMVAAGQNVSSVAPTYSGSSPLTFSLNTTPVNANFEIDSLGIISIFGDVPNGTYIIDVTASNNAGTETFLNAYTFEITGPVSLSNLTYSTSTLSLDDGETGSSVAPSIDGTAPITYSVSVVPSTNDISIDVNTGQISVDNPLPIGTYAVTVNATNSVGSVLFSDVYTIIVSPVLPSGLAYSPNSMGLVLGGSGTSSTPTISGSPTISYAINVSPASSEITIEGNTGVISASASAAVGSYSIEVLATNGAGTATFTAIYTVNVSASAIVASNLIYSPNNLSLDFGSLGSSNDPSIDGTTPITYSISTSPVSSEITINSSTGVIDVSSSTATGSYSVTVATSNAGGNVDFAGVFTITVNASTVPSNLVYSPTSIDLTEGSAGTSGVPAVSGSTPITYTIGVSPSSSEITIDANTGEISVSSSASVGSYLISVIATNSAGTIDFTDIYTVNVNGVVVAPSSLVYSPSTITLTQGSTDASATPTVSGTTPITYSISTSPASSEITINSSTGIISISGSTVIDVYTITVTATNTGGNTTTSYTVIVNGALVSFADDISSIINNNCGSCHLPGGNRVDYTIYSNASANATQILNKIQGIGSIMPPNPRPALSQTEIDLIDQWITDGKQP